MSKYRALLKSDYEKSTCISTNNNKVKFKDLSERENLTLDMTTKNETRLKFINGNDLVIRNGANREVARACGFNEISSATNVKNCLTFKKPTLLTTDDLQLFAGDSGGLFIFNDAAATITLPDSGDEFNVGCTFTFMSLNSDAGVKKILCTDTTNEKFYGAIMGIDIGVTPKAVNIYQADASTNFSAITFNGTTTGTVNSWVTITSVLLDTWVITGGTILQTGSPASPFTTS